MPKVLGKQTNKYSGLEIIALSRSVSLISFKSDEVSAFCPVTHQPDMYDVEISLLEPHQTIESKSLKLFLNSLRDEGIFAEELAIRIHTEIKTAILESLAGEEDIESRVPSSIYVQTKQKPRGGISITTDFEDRLFPKRVGLVIRHPMEVDVSSIFGDSLTSETLQ